MSDKQWTVEVMGKVFRLYDDFCAEADAYDGASLTTAKHRAAAIVEKAYAAHAPKRQIPDKFHPGEYLKEEIEERGGDFWMLQRKSSLSRITVDDIIAEKQNITPEIAEQLSEILGTSAELWLNLQEAYDAHTPKMEELVNWARAVDSYLSTLPEIAIDVLDEDQLASIQNAASQLLAHLEGGGENE